MNIEDKQGLLQPGVTQVCLIEHWTFEYKSYETNRGNPKKTNVHGALFMIAWGLPCLGAQLRPTTVLVWQGRMKSITTMWALATRETTSQKERNTHSWRRALFIVWLNMQGNDFSAPRCHILSITWYLLRPGRAKLCLPLPYAVSWWIHIQV